MQQGRQAALATREAPDVFTLRVAGLQPDQEVAVETSYVQLARVEGLAWSLRIPLTTAPRYVREDEIGSRHAAGQPLLVLRDPGHRFALDVTVRGVAAVTSPTHALTLAPEDHVLRVRLAAGEVLPDRDCVLTWRPAQEEDRPALRVMLHDDAASAHVYFLALLTPPSKIQSVASKIPREVILLVDHSGSMEGAKWEAADWAVKRFLAGLDAEDAFALGLFHTTTSWLRSAPRPATAEAVAEAIRYLEEQRDSGGTNLGVALGQALGLPRSSGECARHVLIITDAQVSDEGRLLHLADLESAREDRRRISVLCVDAAPNAFLAGELAERGGGVARFLTSSPEEEDITTALDTVLEEWAAPLILGLSLGVDRSSVEVGQAVLLPRGDGRRNAYPDAWSAVDLGDLPAGRAVWVVGRVPRGERPELAFRVATAEGQEIASRRAQVAESAAPREALKALFGARRVLGLEFLIHSGADPAEALTRMGYDAAAILAGATGPHVYAENARADTQRLLRDFLVREALDCGIACAETAFVAVRTEAGKRIEGTVSVANALPSGWSGEMLSFYAGAPSATAQGPARMGLVGSSLPYPSLRPASAASPAGRPPFLRRIQKAFTGAAEPVAEGSAGSRGPVFAGVPELPAGEALLFDSTRSTDALCLPEEVTLTRLQIRFPDGDPVGLDPALTLLLYVEDLAQPRARVRLVDLVAQGHARPLNIRRRPGQVVRLVLQDPRGSWAEHAPRLEVTLG